MNRRRARRILGARRPSVLAILALSLVVASTSSAAPPVPLVSPWMDHHDRVEAVLERLGPEVRVRRHDLERAGGRNSREWWPAFGFPEDVDLSARLVVLENAPHSALSRLRAGSGGTLAEALPGWVRAGGHLLIIGGSPSLESYAGTALEGLMGFVPDEDVKGFTRRTRRAITDGRDRDLFVEHLHGGRKTSAEVVLEAGGAPFLIRNRVGRGVVTTLLSGAQGGLRRDGGEPPNEWFESEAWERRLVEIVSSAHGDRLTLGPPPARPTWTPPDPDAFDVRYFRIGHMPSPFTYAPGEAYAEARKLHRLGFTSVVYAAISRRPLDDVRALREIADAGLRIVYYESVRPKSPRSRFWSSADTAPPKARDEKGKDAGWDIHSESFRSAASRLLSGREGVADLPLRAVQVVEEFRDNGVGPGLQEAFRARGLPRRPVPGDPRWIEAQIARADETARTFHRFQEEASRLFPGLPQSTYWPGSYWSRPHHYGFRLSTLGDVVDEVMAPGYGYGAPKRGHGAETVRWSANSGWSALRHGESERPHLAIYGMGRPLKRPSKAVPDETAWRETTWTALAHGATGLAYWALPRSDATESLGRLHDEAKRLGPWLAALDRSPARLAIVQSWTSRSESGAIPPAKALDQCLKDTHAALELAFEDVDLVLEEHLSALSDETKALVIVSSPALSQDAADSLVAFLRRGGRLFVEPGSAIRSQPGGRPLDLAQRSGRADQIHELPMRLRCRLARASRTRAAGPWTQLLGEIGLSPRFRTAAIETASALRGGSELAHVYGLNHGKEAATVEVALGSEWADRDWVELRSGARARTDAGGRLRSQGPLATGEAAIWASVTRPAVRADVSVEPEGAEAALQIRVLDAAGAPVADGYPLRVEVEPTGACAAAFARSIVSSGGRVRVVLGGCGSDDLDAVSWRLSDPLSGRVLARSASVEAR